MKKFNFLNKLLILIFLSVAYSSCNENILENLKPSWLGESIYEQLQAGYKDESTGKLYSFKTFVRLIDDLGYSEVLKLTGSNTLFVADDEAFDRFYQSNSWGVKTYEALTLSQKKMLLNSAMINNAYLVELMSATEGPVKGQALRRSTALSYIDTITHEIAANQPLNINWDYYKNENGIYLVKDNTPVPMVHFLQKQMNFSGITNDDFSFIFNGKTRQDNDAHIFGNKVIVRDITCKNGYINILEDVLIPLPNMAELIRTQSETQYFSNLLERFSAPYYNGGATRDYKLLNPTFTDSIFSKKYFAERSSNGSNITNDKEVVQAGYLEFDPGWNTYNTGGMQFDMAAMFVPTDEALNNFFNSGGGKFLVEKYGTVEDIPNSVIDDLLRNHMKSSFLSSLPHNFSQIVDDGKQSMGISKSDVVKSYLANNGVVYVTNKIYAPASYIAVTAPVLINDYTKIFNYEVGANGFNAYLLSMESRYSFLVPLDISNVGNSYPQGMYYVDPVSYAKMQPEILKFKFKLPNSVVATAYKYDIATGEIGDSLRVVSADEISNRFEDLLDYHIVVGDVETGKKFYRTKGGGEIQVSSTNSTQILGGGNIELGKITDKFTPDITKVYDQTKESNGRGNGKTYLLNSPLLPPYRSVYKILSEEPQFSAFFNLLNREGADNSTLANEKYAIFYNSDKNYAMMDYNVEFFNTYHYTVYVPTNEAIQNAIIKGLPTWDIIAQENNEVVKDSLATILVNFLKYHFQDNSVYIDGSSSSLIPYETAAYTSIGDKAYYKLYTKLDNDNLTVYSQPNGTQVQVRKDDGLYNIMAREYLFNGVKKSGDKTLNIENATSIETSSWAVIHQIDGVLLYSNDILKKAKRMMIGNKLRYK